MSNNQISIDVQTLLRIAKLLEAMVVSFNDIAMASVDDKSLDLGLEIFDYLREKKILEKMSESRSDLFELLEENSLLVEEFDDVIYWKK